MKILQLLNLETGASPETIKRIIGSAPKRYKVYQIPKRNGGERTIAHPAKELKILQRIVLREVLEKEVIHPIATAYVKGRGILMNAKLHQGQRWVLKLDFNNFFPSIVPSDWDRVVRRSATLKEWMADRDQLHRILFWGAGSHKPTCLSIGAPTSPAVSNLVCANLDAWLFEHASKRGIVVSRYADDITASSSSVRQLLSFEKALSTKLSVSKGLNLSLNHEKRGIYGPGERKMVTGLILTPDGNISIGRERKRYISSLIHRFVEGQSTEEMVYQAKGLLAFANAVEPVFMQSMKAKYGETAILVLMKAESPFDSLLIARDI